MSLQQIETELNARFADYNKSSPRNIIFWYDKDGQYADEIDSINLSHAKLQKLSLFLLVFSFYLNSFASANKKKDTIRVRKISNDS